MKKIQQLTLFLIILAFVSSCKDDDFDRDPVLIIPEKTLNFGKAADVKSLDFEINDGDELYYVTTSAAGTDWIRVTTVSDKIEVAVAENIADGSREATIKVMLRKGNISETITVTQNDGSYIKASEEALRYLFQGGELTLYVESSSEWSFTPEGEGDWLTIDPAEASKNKLLLTATENTEINERVAVIILTNTKDQKFIVTVTQNGLTHYELPILELGYVYHGEESERGIKYLSSLTDAYKFEAARDNSFLRIDLRYMHVFTSRSTALSMVSYGVYQLIQGRVEAVRNIFAYDTDKTRTLTLQEDPEFLAYIKKQGFEYMWKTTPDSTTTYWNEETQVSMQIWHPTRLTGQKGLSFVHCKTKPNAPDNQVDAFPTFDALPMSYVEWGTTAKKVIDWETERGSKLIDDGDSSTLVFAADMERDPEVIERVYYLNEEGLLGSSRILLEYIEKGFYQTGILSENDAYIPTREFTNLIKNNGYEFVLQGSFPPQAHYQNVAKDMKYVIHVERYKAEGFMPRLCVSLSPIPMD